MVTSQTTPTTQAYVDSSTVTATSTTATPALTIAASSENNTTTTANGSATGDTVGVGVAVAINDAVSNSQAWVASTTGTTAVTAPTIAVLADTAPASSPMPNILNSSASATSGGAAGTVALAGALAINLVSNTEEAYVPSGSTVSTAGDVTFNAQDNATEGASAQPVGAGSSGGSTLGVGASVALNIATNTTLADLQDTAQLTKANNLTFTAGSNDTITTSAVTCFRPGCVCRRERVRREGAHRSTAGRPHGGDQYDRGPGGDGQPAHPRRRVLGDRDSYGNGETTDGRIHLGSAGSSISAGVALVSSPLSPIRPRRRPSPLHRRDGRRK